MSDTPTPADGQAQAQRIGGGYARLLSGIVKDFGVSHDAAASIVARAGHWSMTCDACGTRYGPDGTCSTCEPAPAEKPTGAQRLTRRQAAVIGAFTGYTCGPFGDVHGYVDSLPGFSGISTIGFVDELDGTGPEATAPAGGEE